MEEEARVLKTAFSVQISQNKEITENNRKLNDAIIEAVSYIRVLENQNSQLKEQVKLLSKPDYIIPLLPPDVF